MVFNNKNLSVLEIDKVLHMLSQETDCEDACEQARNIKPTFEYEEVKVRLNETNDAHMLLGRFGVPSFKGLYNVENSIIRASAGGILNMSELLKISSTLSVFRVVKSWKEHSDAVETSLDKYFELIVPNKYFEEKIKRCILSEDEVSDSASSTLAEIRRKIKNYSSKVRSQLDKFIHSTKYQKYLQEPIVTIRENRFVIPVKSEYRSEIQGLVHDTSSSGATLFIEPISVVEINNDIKVLYSKEEKEIERILKALSEEVSNFADSILVGYKESVKLNVIFAKAKLAYNMKASLPIINKSGIINLRKARHPLIESSKVIPIDVYLGDKFDSLVITGPNTGGKTVSIKTVGLLTLMAMCGLMIPAADNSEISIFGNVLADIGDEQSIEQSLSTFSSHMVNIINILNQSNSESLVLLDELGSGTDPVEGAALAISILEELLSKGAKVISTTHYSELKSYALQNPRVENACCEFDVKTLKPTYKLLIGVPGRSNAFAISERLGIDHSIIERAKLLVSDENRRFEEVIKNLESSRQDFEKSKDEANRLMLEAADAKNQAQITREKIEKEAQIIIEKAHEEAAKLLDKTRRQADNIISELEKLKKDKELLNAENRAKMKSQLRALEEMSDPISHKDNNNYKLPRKLKKGDNVLIFDIDKKGIVIEEEDSSGKVFVQAGIMKVRVPIENLRLLEEKKPQRPIGVSRRNVKGVSDIKVETEIDLRGKYAFDAITELDKCIDNALLAKINKITVIHGKGTGKLRKEIHNYLKKHPMVKSYRLGVFGEGEAGVTIIELK